MRDYRIVNLRGNQVGVKLAQGGGTHFVHLTNVKYVLPIDNIIDKIPDYKLFG